MKVGIVGGTFDPVHEGHIKIGQTAYEALQLDEIWYMPVNQNPFTKNCVASGQERIEMLQIALKDYYYMTICDYELSLPHTVVNYTYNTMQVLTKKYPEVEFYYIIGADQVELFDAWYEANKLSDLVHMVALNRKGYSSNYPNISKYKMITIDYKPIKASSTAIKAGHLKHLNPRVLAYITKKGLYLDTMIEKYMSNKRYLHSLSVASCAKEIAMANGLDASKAYIAGLLHDIAKELDGKKAKFLMEQHYPEHLDASPPVWHQWLSCYLAKKDFLCDDIEILKAIEHHTTASTDMSDIDMCVYIADKYEHLRGFDSKPILELACKDIHKAFKASLEDFYAFSIKKNRPIDAVFFEVYNKYKEL